MAQERGAAGSDDGSTLPVWLFNLWYFLVRYLAPLAIIVVFLHGIGII